MPLYADIMKFSSLGDILLVGDFNARTAHMQAPFFEQTDLAYQEIDIEGTDLARNSQDSAPCTEYGEHLL